MVGQNQKTQQSTNEHSISTSRRSVLSTVGAGVAALGVGVGSTGSVKAASGTPFPTDPSEWSVSTSKPEDTEINVSSAGSGISCDFTENSVASETFEYSTTATETGTVDLDWMTSGWSTEYTTYFEASISVNGHKTELLHRYKRRDALDGSGQTTLSINEGDEIGRVAESFRLHLQ